MCGTRQVREWTTGGEACVTTLTASTPRLHYEGGRGMPGRGHMPNSNATFVVAGFGDGKVWRPQTRLREGPERFPSTAPQSCIVSLHLP